LPQRLNLLQLLAPQLINFVVECQWSPFSSLRSKGDYKQCQIPVFIEERCEKN